MKTVSRRRFGALVGSLMAKGLVMARGLAMAGGLVPAAVAAPTDYPTRPVRIVVPFAAGSATDTFARVLANELTQRLGKNFIVDDRPGAFGQIAAVHVAKSPADGYTVFLTTNSTHSSNQHLYKSLQYDPVKDFEPVARTANLPFMVVVGADSPAKSLADLLALARSRPDGLTYAMASTSSLIASETIAKLGGVKLSGVMYKASPQAIGDVAAGRVDFMAADFVTAMPQMSGGRVRVLAVADDRRSALLPNVPAVAETLKGFSCGSWNGLFVPAGTPKAIVDRLSRETLDILARPDVVARLAGIGFEVAPLGPVPFAAYLREQSELWGRRIREAGIQPQ